MIPTECGCGCGALINEKVIAVVEARRSGCSVRQAAERAGVTYATAKMAGRQFSRFRPGHGAYRGKWEERTCPHCHQTYRTPPTSDRTRCRNCPALAFPERIKLNMAEYDARQEAKNARLRENRVALFGGRPPKAMGTPRWLQQQRDAWDRQFFAIVEDRNPNSLSREEQRLVDDNRGLIRFSLKRYHPPPGMDDDDLWQVGALGLMQAARKFDPEKGFKFSTFATTCIQNEVAHLLTILSAQKRGGTRTAKGGGTIAAAPTSLDLLAESGFDVPTHDALDLGESELVSDVLMRAASVHRHLPEILRRRMDGDPITEISADLGISKQRVYQILESAKKLVAA